MTRQWARETLSSVAKEDYWSLFHDHSLSSRSQSFFSFARFLEPMAARRYEDRQSLMRANESNEGSFLRDCFNCVREKSELFARWTAMKVRFGRSPGQWEIFNAYACDNSNYVSRLFTSGVEKFESRTTGCFAKCARQFNFTDENNR